MNGKGSYGDRSGPENFAHILMRSTLTIHDCGVLAMDAHADIDTRIYTDIHADKHPGSGSVKMKSADNCYG